MKQHRTICYSLLTLLAIMVTIQPVQAEIHQGRNVLGLSTQNDENGSFELAEYPPGTLELHLLVFGFEYPQGINGWDCVVVLPEGVTLLRTDLMGQGTNARPQPGYYGVTTAEPLMPENGIIHLATLHLLIADQLPKDFYLAPAPLWGNIGGMEFGLATDESLRRHFTWPMGCSDCPVFRTTNITQSADNPTWDWVKTLYQ